MSEEAVGSVRRRLTWWRYDLGELARDRLEAGQKSAVYPDTLKSPVEALYRDSCSTDIRGRDVDNLAREV